MEWKTATVVPVFKRGDRSKTTNYRPISLLCIVSKVLEKLVSHRLAPFLQPLISSRQSGFQKHDGTVFQLLRLVQRWSEALDASEQVGVIFLDLKKAFDRVWHAGLIAKLHAAGVRGQLLAWLTDFLSNRQQRVRVGSAISDCAGLHAGVPQGAVLSPLLFLLYINDVAESVKSAEVNLFANDTSAYILEKDPSKIEEC